MYTHIWFSLSVSANTYGEQQKTAESVQRKKKSYPMHAPYIQNTKRQNKNIRIAPAPNIVYFDTFDTTIRKEKKKKKIIDEERESIFWFLLKTSAAQFKQNEKSKISNANIQYRNSDTSKLIV